jgi:nucleoside-diphosphate-sugar epimerase
VKILVTGGSGVIGAGLLPELLRAGHQVRLLSRKAPDHVETLPEGVEAVPADITRAEELSGVANGCDAVIHISGIAQENLPKVTFESVNVDGTRNLIGALGQEKPFFIFISSLGAERGKSEYHQSKKRAEDLVRSYSGRWLILRPGNVYGPGDEVISTLLKMTQTLPVVPVVDNGDQPFQPIYYADLGRALARAVERIDLAGQILEIAGQEVTSTNDLFKRFGLITGRTPVALPVASWLVELGARAVESFDGLGEKLLESFGIGSPINTSKLNMLLEGSVIEPPGRNALLSIFGVPPTPLQEGLELLVDALPEQTPKEGVGALEEKTFWADIENSQHSAAALLNLFIRNFGQAMAVEVSALSGSADEPRAGDTFTVTLPGRGDIQVRLEEKTKTAATFATLEGHPLSGLLKVSAEAVGSFIRFQLRICARASNIIDWVSFQTMGNFYQNQNWRMAVRRAVELSGGSAPKGIQKESRTLSPVEARQFEKSVEAMVRRRQRNEMKSDVTNARAA